MDARRLKYSDGSFECVIDKGLLDSVLVFKKSFKYHFIKNY